MTEHSQLKRVLSVRNLFCLFKISSFIFYLYDEDHELNEICAAKIWNINTRFLP